MNATGSLESNPDRFRELFYAIITQLSKQQARLAIWAIEDFDLSQFKYQIIGSNSSFKDSNSKLAGDGILINLEPTQVQALTDTLEPGLGSSILHMEIEANGSVQFSAYDGMLYAVFGDEISLKLLEELKGSEIIYSYETSNSK
ncbi:hypothetical protein [Chamaesiphon polymorphus]|uniref:Uncharacterized protein n=1 Tax=Chamaesiphon polymorphus CCALA 037 TaxID=2107692 RepID=A0A2T1GDU3_9CYAN|nr:hypothetical protein [Chamaesiphon polymorphus]PSB55572.1 hypothetical protein C7B77_14560 [Chamaesiphon polymorphus CCALA 037]